MTKAWWEIHLNSAIDDGNIVVIPNIKLMLPHGPCGTVLLIGKGYYIGHRIKEIAKKTFPSTWIVMELLGRI